MKVKARDIIAGWPKGRSTLPEWPLSWDIQTGSIYVIDQYEQHNFWMRTTFQQVREVSGYLTRSDAERVLDRQYHDQQARDYEGYMRKSGLWVPTHEYHPPKTDERHRMRPVAFSSGE
jgi:hypothetical protein